MERLSELKKKLEAPNTPDEFPQEWYAGLAAQPSRFTEQLLNLQEALHLAGQGMLPAGQGIAPESQAVHVRPRL